MERCLACEADSVGTFRACLARVAPEQSGAAIQGWRPLTASQARQRPRGGDTVGIESEAALQGDRKVSRSSRC
jgi:hypothetical protein